MKKHIQTWIRRIKYFLSEQKRKQDKIDKLFATKKHY